MLNQLFVTYVIVKRKLYSKGSQLALQDSVPSNMLPRNSKDKARRDLSKHLTVSTSSESRDSDEEVNGNTAAASKNAAKNKSAPSGQAGRKQYPDAVKNKTTFCEEENNNNNDPETSNGAQNGGDGNNGNGNNNNNNNNNGRFGNKYKI